MFRKRRIAALTATAAQHRARAGQLDRDGDFFKAKMERAKADRLDKRSARLERK